MNCKHSATLKVGTTFQYNTIYWCYRCGSLLVVLQGKSKKNSLWVWPKLHSATSERKPRSHNNAIAGSEASLKCLCEPKEFHSKMKAIAKKENGDIECVHAYQDDLMCELLVSLGYGKGIKVFNDTDKWYA